MALEAVGSNPIIHPTEKPEESSSGFVFIRIHDFERKITAEITLPLFLYSGFLVFLYCFAAGISADKAKRRRDQRNSAEHKEGYAPAAVLRKPTDARCGEEISEMDEGVDNADKQGDIALMEIAHGVETQKEGECCRHIDGVDDEEHERQRDVSAAEEADREEADTRAKKDDEAGKEKISRFSSDLAAEQGAADLKTRYERR